MDLIYEIAGIILLLLGVIGSFLPVLPGPLSGWLGLFIANQSTRVDFETSFIITTFCIALAVFLLDYIIPALGTKKFGGSKKGVIGSTIGLVLGLLFLGPLGIILGPFIGAFSGELLNEPNKKVAFKAAIGSFLGFITGVILKCLVALAFLFLGISEYMN